MIILDVATNTVQTIAAAEARPRCAGISNIEERLRAAMIATINHYMETTETGRLKAAVMAAMLESEPVERDRIARSFRALTSLNNCLAAIHSGVPVDMSLVEDPPPDCISILSIWESVKATEVKPIQEQIIR